MNWRDEAIVLSARRHGESAAVVGLLTREHGRHAGLVRGASGTGARGVLQTGNLVAATWNARLADHLGQLKCELLRAHAADLLDDPGRLAALAAACALVEAVLAEREPHPEVFAGTTALIEALSGEAWAAAYVHWELNLLDALGFGLELQSCAVTGAAADLAYVSPKTGRAVSDAGAGPYRERLLALPGFLIGAGTAGEADILAGLRLTGYFLDRHVLAPHDRGMPAARTRLVDRLSR